MKWGLVIVCLFYALPVYAESSVVPPEGFVLDKRQKIVARPTVAKAVTDVLTGYKVVRPSMTPPDIADRLHRLDELDMQASDDGRYGYYLRGRRDGQIEAILGLLYTTGLIPSPRLEDNRVSSTGGRYYLTNRDILPSRLRALATMLLLTNYKELKPMPPKEIVQVAIPGSRPTLSELANTPREK